MDPETNTYAATEVSGSDLVSARFERWRESELILLRAADAAAAVTLIPDDSVADGDEYSVVRLRSPSPFNTDLFLYIDKKTKMLGRTIYSDGKRFESEDFSDYRAVGGLQFAYKRTSKVGPGTNTFELEVVEVNPEIDGALFDKPPRNGSAGAPSVVR